MWPFKPKEKKAKWPKFRKRLVYCIILDPADNSYKVVPWDRKRQEKPLDLDGIDIREIDIYNSTGWRPGVKAQKPWLRFRQILFKYGYVVVDGSSGFPISPINYAATHTQYDWITPHLLKRYCQSSIEEDYLKSLKGKAGLALGGRWMIFLIIGVVAFVVLLKIMGVF
jgi:hypothetical protein